MTIAIPEFHIPPQPWFKPLHSIWLSLEYGMCEMPYAIRSAPRFKHFNSPLKSQNIWKVQTNVRNKYWMTARILCLTLVNVLVRTLPLLKYITLQCRLSVCCLFLYFICNILLNSSYAVTSLFVVIIIFPRMTCSVMILRFREQLSNHHSWLELFGLFHWRTLHSHIWYPKFRGGMQYAHCFLPI